jgi:hypothetical protein
MFRSLAKENQPFRLLNWRMSNSFDFSTKHIPMAPYDRPTLWFSGRTRFANPSNAISGAPLGSSPRPPQRDVTFLVAETGTPAVDLLAFQPDYLPQAHL